MVVMRWWAHGAASRKHYLTRLEYIVTHAPRIREKRHAAAAARVALGGQHCHVPLREDVELEPVRHAELVVDAAQVIAQRVLADVQRSEEHTSELQSRLHLVC